MFLSILFEKAKHFIELKARESQMEAIFNQLFGELTVMGFIGLCIFVLGHVTGWLPHSHVVLLEEVHMIVFVVAIIYLLFVCAMVAFAAKTQKMWRRFEVHACATVDGKIAIIDQYAVAMLRLNECWWTRWSPWRQHALYEMRLQLEFHGLRDAFLNKAIPTMRPDVPDHESLSKKLVPQFDFSEYLSKILVSSIEGIVSIQTSTWFVLWILFAPLYVVQDVFDHRKEATDREGTKASIWVVVCVVPYALLAVLLKILSKIRSIHRQLVPLFHFDALKLAGIEPPVSSVAEKMPLLPGAPRWWGVQPHREELLPCTTQPNARRTTKAGMQALDAETCDRIEQHVKSQSVDCHSHPETIPFLSSPTPEAPKHAWLRWFMRLGGWHGLGNKDEVWVPSAHENLFWFGRHGVPFLMSAIQTIMMGFAVYAAVLLTVVMPAVLSGHLDRNNHTSNASEAHPLVGSSNGAEDQPVGYGFAGSERAFLVVVGLLPLTVLLPIFKHTIVGFAMVSHVGMMREPHAVAQVFRDGRTRNSLRILKLLSSMNMQHRDGGTKSAPTRRRGHGSVATLVGGQQVDRAMHQKGASMESAAKAAFRILDEDNSGSIAPVELRHLLARLGMAVSDADLEQIVEELDSDRDGSIDEDEFMDWVRRKEGRQELDLTDPNDVRQFTAEVFAMVDRDGDGSVTTEELYSTLSVLIPDIEASDVREIFADMDEDRDGSVSKEEFAATIKAHASYI